MEVIGHRTRRCITGAVHLGERVVHSSKSQGHSRNHPACCGEISVALARNCAAVEEGRRDSGRQARPSPTLEPESAEKSGFPRTDAAVQRPSD
jgi:hypothetical protein